MGYNPGMETTHRALVHFVENFIRYNLICLKLSRRQEMSPANTRIISLSDTKGLGKLGTISILGEKIVVHESTIDDQSIGRYLELHPPDTFPYSSEQWGQLWRETQELVTGSRREKLANISKCLEDYLLTKEGIRVEIAVVTK